MTSSSCFRPLLQHVPIVNRYFYPPQVLEADEELKREKRNEAKRRLMRLLEIATQRADELKEEIRQLNEKITDNVNRQLTHAPNVDIALAEETQNVINMKNDKFDQYKRQLQVVKDARKNFDRCVETIHIHEIQRESLALNQDLGLPKVESTVETATNFAETRMEMDAGLDQVGLLSQLDKQAAIGSSSNSSSSSNNSGDAEQEYKRLLNEAQAAATARQIRNLPMPPLKKVVLNNPTTTTLKKSFSHLFSSPSSSSPSPLSQLQA